MLPIIKFKRMTLEENIEIVKWCYFDKKGLLNLHDYTIQYFKELSNIDSKMSEEEINNEIERVVTKEYNNLLDKIDKDIEKYDNIWKEYNNKYFTKLSEYLNIEWPNINTIECKVGLIPIFPRYLDDFSYSVSIDLKESDLIKISAHETLHFLWFTKWKGLYPKTKRKEFDSPNVIWQYSEMVTDPILNSKEFAEIFNNIFVEKAYDNFYEINNNKVMNELKQIYNLDISIEDKIKNGYEYVKQFLK